MRSRPSRAAARIFSAPPSQRSIRSSTRSSDSLRDWFTRLTMSFTVPSATSSGVSFVSSATSVRPSVSTPNPSLPCTTTSISALVKVTGSPAIGSVTWPSRSSASIAPVAIDSSACLAALSFGSELGAEDAEVGLRLQRAERLELARGDRHLVDVQFVGDQRIAAGAQHLVGGRVGPLHVDAGERLAQVDAGGVARAPAERDDVEHRLHVAFELRVAPFGTCDGEVGEVDRAGAWLEPAVERVGEERRDRREQRATRSSAS